MPNKKFNYARTSLGRAKARRLTWRYTPNPKLMEIIMDKKIKAIPFLIIFSLIIPFQANAKNAQNAEFRTMKSCLSAIEENGGSPLNIITDKTKEVSGFLPNGEAFGCQKKSSGTKGTYYHGWFTVK